MTYEAFISCLKRFIVRKGKPKIIISDTNIFGSYRKLKYLLHFLKNNNTNQDIYNFCTSNEIQISEGYGRVLKKLFKNHFKRSIMKEFLTIIVQIAEILNSRSLTQLSSDPKDLQPLTPEHFLCDGPIIAPPEPLLIDLPTNKLSQWQKVTQLIQKI